MTSTILYGKSLHQALFGKNPEYKFLKCFGCFCYPLIHNILRNKFEPKTTKCVFLGYSNHKGYNCYTLEKNKIYISRNVKFDESEYPFLNPIKIDKNTTISENQFPITLPNLVGKNEECNKKTGSYHNKLVSFAENSIVGLTIKNWVNSHL